MFTKRRSVNCIGPCFSPPEFWGLSLIRCFITCKTKDKLKLHNRVLAKKACIFTINWNKMEIGASVPGSTALVELSKPDKWQNWQRFASHCVSWQLQGRAFSICCVCCSVTKSGVRGDLLSLCLLLGSCPRASSRLWQRGERSLCQQQPSWGTKVWGEPSHLPGGSAGKRGARLPQAADASADELLVFLRRGPRKAAVGFILFGCLLSCRTRKQGWRKGAACGVAAYSSPQDL